MTSLGNLGELTVEKVLLVNLYLVASLTVFNCDYGHKISLVLDRIFFPG